MAIGNYMLTNGTDYVFLNKRNGIEKTKNKGQGHRYLTKKEAEDDLRRAPSKLKNFYILDLDVEKRETELAKKREEKKLEEEKKKEAESTNTEETSETSKAEPIKKTEKTIRKSFTKEDRIKVYNQSKGRCGICGDFIPFDSNEYTIDHIIPLAKGGTNDIRNLQCACKKCNLMKQDIMPEELLDYMKKIMFYQMRKNYDPTIMREFLKIKAKHDKQATSKKLKKIVKSVKKILIEE